MNQPKIGIALGGGGAKGLAHIGVLRTLLEAGIEPQIVTGASAGALVGAAYAAGRLDRLEDFVRTIKQRDIALLFKPGAAVSNLKKSISLDYILEQILGSALIEELSKSFAAVSVDLKTGLPIVHRAGKLSRAVRASIAVPVVFPTFHSNNTVLVDGALVDPVPVGPARELGAEKILAVDLFAYIEDTISNALEGRDELRTRVVGVLGRMRVVWERLLNIGTDSFTVGDLVERTLAVAQRELTRLKFLESRPDFVISPQVAKVRLTDFHLGKTAIDLGVEAARRALPAIQAAIGKLPESGLILTRPVS